jgi:hypothetical protein
MAELTLDESSLLPMFLGLALVLGLLTAVIARWKGRNFIVWWLYGALACPVALFHVLLAAPKRQAPPARTVWAEGTRRCPHCFETIKSNLEVCPKCWRALAPESPPPEAQPGQDHIRLNQPDM